MPFQFRIPRALAIAVFGATVAFGSPAQAGPAELRAA